MSWPELVTSTMIGFASSAVAVVLTIVMGIWYRSWLPKRECAESLDALKLRNEEARQEYEDLREKHVKAIHDIDEADKRSDLLLEVESRLEELESRRKELEDVESSLALKIDELTRLEEAVLKLRGETGTLELDLDRQRQQLLPLDEFETLKREQSACQEELGALERRKGDLEPRVDELQVREKGLVLGIDEKDRKLAALEKAIAGDEKRLESLGKQIEDLLVSKKQIGGTSAVNPEDNGTKLLWNPSLTDRYPSNQPPEWDEHAALDLAEKRIRDSGLIYDQRVVRAFHTSLKCSEESPLLVLAGLSGTGKSALPNRYAEAMGMHFLNVPVQPGWDSPADLLGFYNHLEGRFRPTELSRAILQMDYVHKAGAGAEIGWPQDAEERLDLSDRMLLVLLDEMNLARVEYYFSEFLSRLELRRGIDPLKDHSARERAELLLDLGAVGDDEAQVLRTFVGRNILFVGTMNEDESTQTLSDKVVDRSNVMRFGRPSNLASSKHVASSVAVPPASLLRETWERWIDDTPPLHDHELILVNDWIAKVNDCLSQVGNPFAYRVAGAIRTYVQQYPDRTSRGLQNAFADQVELRVLPRLRGIDIHERASQEAIEGVRRLVESELEDRVLAGALGEAYESAGDQLFQWHGVDRLASPVMGVLGTS